MNSIVNEIEAIGKKQPKPRKLRKGEEIAMGFSTSNILAIYHMATVEERNNGMVWYQLAHELSGIICHGNTRMGAGIVAALSPAMPWGRNVLAAREVAAGRPCTSPTGAKYQTAVNIAKAMSIYHGADPAIVLKSKGDAQKVYSFFHNVADPSDPAFVTIDRHAYAIALNRSLNDNELGAMKKDEYDRAAGCYREAAETLGILPNQIQAICWVAWRRMKGIKEA